jgi:hypothetical protein
VESAEVVVNTLFRIFVSSMHIRIADYVIGINQARFGGFGTRLIRHNNGSQHMMRHNGHNVPERMTAISHPVRSPQDQDESRHHQLSFYGKPITDHDPANLLI